MSHSLTLGRSFGIVFLCFIIGMTGLIIKTRWDITPQPLSLSELLKDVAKPNLVDRYGNSLTITYTNQWNAFPLELHQIPDTLKKLFVFSEDRRFFHHNGVDWMARLHALGQNLKALDTVRGASTITEQVVRMVHLRKRTLWSRWIEGFEAMALEKSNTKTAILEFYLNQVPYATNRRGISQAALFYFNRSLNTLNLKEMAALVVLVRAPSYYDLRRNPGAITPALNNFADILYQEKMISGAELKAIRKNDFMLESHSLSIDAPHFAEFVFSALTGTAGAMYGLSATKKDESPMIAMGQEESHMRASSDLHEKEITTTLDGSLQNFAGKIMEARVGELQNRNVNNGACLVVDHRTREILAWVCVGDAGSRRINSVLVPRQPGSSLKPFLYALALEKGWTAATLIQDSPLANPVGTGLHTYHNYSRHYYGQVTLRQALGNSLNIPAIRTIEFTGVDTFLSTLETLGIKSLDRHPDFYGDGLALGNGEITLYELVQAYAALASQGVFSTLAWAKEQENDRKRIRVFSPEVASIIANILSDPEARTLEFGRGSLLNFPVETAVKTGTSSDYGDAWALGFNHAYTIGAWMGNLDGRPMNGITGSTGPAMVVRSLFSRLNQKGNTFPLFLSPKLIRKKVELDNSNIGPESVDINSQNNGIRLDEWFVPGTEPGDELHGEEDVKKDGQIGFLKPVNGLEMAMDPRIPDQDEAFEFVLTGVDPCDMVEWLLDDNPLGTSHGGRYLWHLEPGAHVLFARVHKNCGHLSAHRVCFKVK